MIPHVEGTTIPGAPALPEHIKADVYIPPCLLTEQPDCHHPVAAIVQKLIEAIGVPTINQWTAATQNFGWSLKQKGAIPYPPSFYSHIIPPPASTGSTHYIVLGCPYGSLPLLMSPSDVSTSTDSPPTSLFLAVLIMPQLSQSSNGYFADPEEPDSNMLSLMDATKKIIKLEVQLKGAAQMKEAYVSEISNLHDELATTFAKLHTQEAILVKHEALNHGSTLNSSQSEPPSPSKHALLLSPTTASKFPAKNYLSQYFISCYKIFKVPTS
ncbi:hypothetical protein L208DRAFT_1375889 [Tricholoma matsutake]|nr:hypothetical protein L208DRAFT_1375889 [Tricholoma matsutake 945]